MGDIGAAPVSQGPVIPPLDQEQEYEWKWRVSLCFVRIWKERLLMSIAKDGSFKENFLFVDHPVCCVLLPCILYVFLTTIAEQRRLCTLDSDLDVT